LRLIISSATIDAEDVQSYFNHNVTTDSSQDTASILSIEGRTYPVDIHYAEKPVHDYVAGCLTTVMDIHKYQPAGDILVFLTGQEEIDTLVKLIKDKARYENYRKSFF
jgi:ATP-dependent RNA helicase DDX35